MVEWYSHQITNNSMNKSRFAGVPNYWLYKPAIHYAKSRSIIMRSIEELECAVSNYLIYAIKYN